MNDVISEKAEKLLRDEMCLCLEDLGNHLESTVPSKLDFFRDFFEFLVELNPPNTAVELGSSEYFENDEYLNTEIMQFSERFGIASGTDEYFIVDSLRHAFISFKQGGLLSLYKHREAENWYPKVVIRQRLGVNDLKGEIEIYRGTSKYEYDSGIISQSWTLKKEIAHDFAFKHYQNHGSYLNSERVVLKTKINVCHIYYYNEFDNEQEVIIDEREILVVPPTITCQRLLN